MSPHKLYVIMTFMKKLKYKHVVYLSCVVLIILLPFCLKVVQRLTLIRVYCFNYF